MKALVTVILFVPLAIVGVITLRRDNRERRQVVEQLAGRDVVVEHRVGRGAFTTERRGTLSPGGTRWSVVLHRGGTATAEIPLSAIRSITDEATGKTYGTWR